MDFVLVEDRIEQAYSTTELNDILGNHLLSFIRYNPDPFIFREVDISELSRVSIPRKQLVRALAVPISDPEVMKEWLAGLPVVAVQALHLVAWEGSLNVPELERRLDCKVMENRSRQKGVKRLQPEFALLQHRSFNSFWGADGNMDFVDLPPLISHVLKQSLSAPEALEMIGTDKAPAGAAVFLDDGMGMRTVSVISRFIRQGDLEMTRRGKPSVRSLLRLRDASGLTEFYERRHPSELSCLRTRLLLDILLNAKTDAEPSESAISLRELLDVYLKPRCFPHDWFFSHVKGMVYCREQLGDKLHIEAWKILDRLPLNSWITVEEINRFVRLMSIKLLPVDPRCADRYLYITTEWKGWGNKKKYLTPWVYDEALVVPLIKAFLFLYGSLGLLDLAYYAPGIKAGSNAAKSSLTVFDGLKAVRLTELGTVILGRQSWSAERGEVEPLTYELDPKRLLITCSRTDPIADISMKQFSRKISARRYRVDEASFLASCGNVEELKQKINSFREEVDCAIPPVWQRFFEQLIGRADTIRPVENMVVYKLDIDNPVDLAVIGEDHVLRQFVIKAEGRYILVNRAKLQLLKNRLAELGYLL